MNIVKRGAGFVLLRKEFRPMLVVEKKIGENKYEEVFTGDVDAVRGWVSSRASSNTNATIYYYEDFEMNREVYRVVERPTTKGIME